MALVNDCCCGADCLMKAKCDSQHQCPHCKGYLHAICGVALDEDDPEWSIRYSRVCNGCHAGKNKPSRPPRASAAAARKVFLAVAEGSSEDEEEEDEEEDMTLAEFGRKNSSKNSSSKKINDQNNKSYKRKTPPPASSPPKKKGLPGRPQYMKRMPRQTHQAGPFQLTGPNTCHLFWSSCPLLPTSNTPSIRSSPRPNCCW